MNMLNCNGDGSKIVYIKAQSKGKSKEKLKHRAGGKARKN
jgi:hypothetical protein